MKDIIIERTIEKNVEDMSNAEIERVANDLEKEGRPSDALTLRKAKGSGFKGMKGIVDSSESLSDDYGLIINESSTCPGKMELWRDPYSYPQGHRLHVAKKGL